MVDAYAMRGAGGQWIERAPLEVPGLASLPEPFCHGLRCEEFIFASGQSALDERGEVLFAGDLPSQNRYALDGVAAQRMKGTRASRESDTSICPNPPEKS